MKSPSWLSPSSPMVWSRRDRLAGVLLDLQHLVRRDVHFLGELFGRRLAAEVLQQLTLDAAELVDDLDHVHRDADGAGLVGHRAGDRLADPPRRVGRELVALGVVELLDRADQAEVALLDEVEERHAAAGVALGQRDDEAQVRLEQVVLRPLAVADDPAQIAADLQGELLVGLFGLAQPLGGVETGLDALGEVDLFLGVEQRDLADLLEVGADGVGRRRHLGVLARLAQRLGLLFLVPDDLVGLGAFGGNLGVAVDGDDVGRVDGDRVLEPDRRSARPSCRRPSVAAFAAVWLGATWPVPSWRRSWRPASQRPSPARPWRCPPWRQRPWRPGGRRGRSALRGAGGREGAGRTSDGCRRLPRIACWLPLRTFHHECVRTRMSNASEGAPRNAGSVEGRRPSVC